MKIENAKSIIESMLYVAGRVVKTSEIATLLEMTPDEVRSSNIVTFLGKPREAFSKADIKKFVKAAGISHINFMYAGGDGRLKTLNFVIHSQEYLDEILSCGERVDGSSLFGISVA